MTEENAIVIRTAELIADEINSIKTETFRFLEAATSYANRQTFEIGKRLIEAKKLVDSGKWIDWLRDSVDYSEDTAQNLMRIYREYDSGNTSIQGMSYSQLVAMFPLPPDKREEFVEENDVPNLSVKEIKKLIRDKESAERRLKAAENKVSNLEKTNEELDKKVKESERSSELDKKTAGRYIEEKRELEKKLKAFESAPPKVERVEVPGEVTPEQLESIREEVRQEYEDKLNEQAKAEMKQDPVLVEINVMFNQVQRDIQSVYESINKAPSEEAVKLRSTIGGALSEIIRSKFGG